MSLIYTLVARGSKIILTDYTEFSGNFQQISLVILNKIKKDKKCTIDYDDYTFYYEDDMNLTFLCMSKGLREEVVFSYLADLRKKFIKKYDWKIISNSYAYQLRDFNDEIKSLVIFYEGNPNHSKSGVLLSSLNETVDVLRESVEKILERNEKLSIIAQKSKNLKNVSDDMRTIATKIRRNERRNYSLYILVLLAILICFFLVLYMIFKN